MSLKFKLGNTLRDKVTGVTGMTTGYLTYYNGCRQWNIHPKVGDDGKQQDALYYDEQQLEFVDDGIAAGATNIDQNDSDAKRGGSPSSPRGID